MAAAEGEERGTRRRSSDAPFRRLVETWLPAIIVIGGGLIAWGTFQQGLTDTTRRVAVVERHQERDANVMERLASIEATLSYLKSQVDRIADPAQGRPR